MLDYDVFSIVGVTGQQVGMNDLAVSNGAHFIERLAVCITMQGTNINSFVKACVNGATRCVDGIAHKAVLTTFPRRRFHAFVIAFDILVKGRAVAREQSVIIRRQNKIESLILRGVSPHRDQRKNSEDNCRSE